MSMMQVFVLNVVFATKTKKRPSHCSSKGQPTNACISIQPPASQPAVYPRPKSTKKGRKKRNQKYTKND